MTGLFARRPRPALLKVLSLSLLAAGPSAHAIDDPEADWAARSRGTGVFYADNFAGLKNDAELRSRSFLQHKLNTTRLFLETGNALSAGGAARIEVHPQDGEGTATYSHSFDGVGSQTKTRREKELYYQFSVYIPKYMLDHRFRTNKDSGNVGHKFTILQEPDKSFRKGEIVITSIGFTHVVGAYTVGPKGTHPFYRKWPAGSGNPCRPNTPDYQWQAPVDAGPQLERGKTDANNCDLFRRRFGMFYSYYKQHPVFYGKGTVSEQGYPEAESARHGINWVPDAWNVIQIYVSEPSQTVKVWHARRGEAPRLVVQEIGTADMGFREGNYTGAQLLPRLEERAADTTREASFVIYDEIIASTSPIPFPGGHHIDGSPAHPSNPHRGTQEHVDR